MLVSSAAARIGLANHEAIAAAKAGIEGLALAAAASYAPKGLHALQILPLAAWALRHVGRLGGSQQTAVVFGLAVACALTMAAALRQALAGQPLWPS